MARDDAKGAGRKDAAQGQDGSSALARTLMEGRLDEACRLLDQGADTIVLGCTHYPFLQPLIERLCGPSVRVIDPAPAVARQTVKVLEQRGVPVGIGPFSVELHASGDPSSLNRLFANL